MDISQWNKIPFQKRNEIKAHYGIRPSAQVKVISVGNGVDSIEDDGIREQDLELIAHVSVEDCIALKPITEPEQIVEPSVSVESVSEVTSESVELGGVEPKKKEVKKRGRPSKKK